MEDPNEEYTFRLVVVPQCVQTNDDCGFDYIRRKDTNESREEHALGRFRRTRSRRNVYLFIEGSVAAIARGIGT